MGREEQQRRLRRQEHLSITLAKSRALSGVSSDGLRTQVQPAARAAATLRPIIPMGKFHCIKGRDEYIASVSFYSDIFMTYFNFYRLLIVHDDVCFTTYFIFHMLLIMYD